MSDEREFIVYNIRETYHELGEYEFKIVLSPSKYKNAHDSDVRITDSDGNLMEFEANKWGRKINCKFKIDENVADGVSSVLLDLRRHDGTLLQSRLYFWVIK